MAPTRRASVSKRSSIAAETAAREAKKKQAMVGTFRKTSAWDAKFSAKKRSLFSASFKMAASSREATRTATFKLSADALVLDHAEGKPTTVTVRFPVVQPLTETLLSVGKEFGWTSSAMLFLTDAHGWERPVSTDAALDAAFAHWDATSGPRTRSKYNTLFAEVEEYLGGAAADQQLRGAGAAWEIACRDTHHAFLRADFLEALHSLLASGGFAAATHAAAAVNMLAQLPETLARFQPRIVEALDQALRTALHPLTPAALADVCRGSPAFLARQPVLALHRMLDSGTGRHTQHAALLARCHGELTLWRMLLRVAPVRTPPAPSHADEDAGEGHSDADGADGADVGADGDGGDGGGSVDATAGLGLCARPPRPPPRASALSSADVAGVREAEASLQFPSRFGREERGLRLATLETLASLVALQPTACGGRLAAAGALPHLAGWLRVFLDEYLTDAIGPRPRSNRRP